MSTAFFISLEQIFNLSPGFKLPFQLLNITQNCYIFGECQFK